MEAELSVELTIDGEWLILDVIANVTENGYYDKLISWKICTVVQPVLARFYAETTTSYKKFFDESVAEAINNKLNELNSRNRQAAEDFLASIDLNTLPENESEPN